MPKLQILSGKREGTTYQFVEGEVLDIGNRKSAKLSIRDPWVSYNHATIKREGDRYVIEDHNSSNGTWINQRKIGRHELAPNDVIYLGKTKVRFVTEEIPAPPPVQEDREADMPWWDQVLETEGQGQPQGSARQLRALEAELEDERRMREALEKFLSLPAGAKPGDAAKAGELEAEVERLQAELRRVRKDSSSEGSQVEEIVAVQTEKLRREHMSRLVELEERAARAQAKVVELEERLKSKDGQSQDEVKRVRERLQTEIDRLEGELRAQREAAKNQGSAASEDEISRKERERLEAELEETRKGAGQAAERVHELEGQLSQLTVDLEAAKAESLQWQEEHRKVVQEIDEISMEQIDIEDELQGRIGDLENQLGGGTESPAEEPAETSAKVPSESDPELALADDPTPPKGPDDGASEDEIGPASPGEGEQVKTASSKKGKDEA